MNKYGIEIPSILLPQAAKADLTKWPVIACDQFTQDRGYWERANEICAGSPSTLNMIFPEVFLCDDGAAQRIADIHSTMKQYLSNGVFGEPHKGFIYIERDTPFQKKRRGLAAAVDLEHYDWRPEARPLIRSTEGTVEERLPARMDIRRGAPLELPHILLLLDDDTDSLLPQLGERVKKAAPLYNTPLMMDSGGAAGWLVEESGDMSFISQKLDELLLRSISRYDGGKPFLFAVGDGNHSLAAAKGVWDEVKSKNKEQGTKNNELCRYALAEIENIYDPAIQFEPIHRLVFGIGFDEIISLLSQLPGFTCRPADNVQELSQFCRAERQRRMPCAGNRFAVVSEGRYAQIETSASGIATACLQPLLDVYAADNPQLIDYIHDEKELFRLAENRAADHPASGRRAGILLPPVQKSGLFETVARLGPLPRKSFSMGHSCEKRFYLECRKLY